MSMRGWITSGFLAAALVVSPSARADDATPPSSTTVPWIVTTVGGALVVGGLTAMTVNTVSFTSDKDDLQSKKTACGLDRACNASVDSQYNDLTTAASRRNFLFGIIAAAGGLTTAIGVISLVNASKTQKASITLVPTVGTEMNGASLVGRF